MSRGDAGHGLALAVALSLALGAAIEPSRRPASIATAAPPLARERLPDGRPALRDAGGRLVPLVRYRRVASTTLLADRLLFALAEPGDIAAVSATGARTSPFRHLFAGKPTVDAFGAVETIIDLRPDLVLLGNLAGAGHVDRLRSAGVEVFDLGEMRGLRTLPAQIQAIADLVGAPERGEDLARALPRRVAAVAAPLGIRPRRRGLFVSAAAGRLYGGTIGTSYHDVLVGAGLEDVAARSFHDWPAYSAEELLALDPDLVVMEDGGGASLCATPGLDRLPACASPGRILELPGGYLDDPGPTILEAAELLFAKAYPDLADGRGTAPPR
jgi:iron complex transport system substrate-binding protein